MQLIFRLVKMQAMWKPAWLYTLMPWLYAAGGIVALIDFELWCGRAAGALLLSAALMVWGMRRQNCDLD